MTTIRLNSLTLQPVYAPEFVKVASKLERYIGVDSLTGDDVICQLVQLAIIVEPDLVNIVEWWTTTPIQELGNRTAEELVEAGRDDLVEGFLLSIIFGERG